MKRALMDFCLSCRKELIVALLAVNLSGCASIHADDVAHGFYILTIPIWYPILSVARWVIDTPILARAEKKANAAVARKPLVQKARDYLKAACEQDEQLFIKPGITLGKDNKILILRSNQGDAPLPLLETAPEVSAPDEIIAFRKCFRKESRKESIRMFREIQYGYVIPWDDDKTLYAAWDAFPESTAAERKFFIETGTGKYIQRASKAFWEQAGLRERVIKEYSTLVNARDASDRYYTSAQHYKYSSEQRLFDLPIDAPPSAKYALSIEDISTLEDRAHWVGRGRLRLTERETGETVAEYIGFVANLIPGYQRKSPWRWKNSDGADKDDYQYWDDVQRSEDTELCPNAAKDPYEIVRSFLQKILDAKQP